MKLIGSYLSHFVRRVAIPLNIYGIEFELVEASVATDQDVIQKHSKLARVPSLVLDDGEILIDSDYILKEIDLMVPVADRLVPVSQDLNREYGQVLASLTGSMDKATAWFYESFRRPKVLVWDEWAGHLRSQLVGGILQVEERLGSDMAGPDYLFENRMTHADIAVGLVVPLGKLAAGELVNEKSCPKLCALADRMNSLDAFAATAASS